MKDLHFMFFDIVSAYKEITNTPKHTPMYIITCFIEEVERERERER